jgi:adenylate cyclase class 2
MTNNYTETEVKLYVPFLEAVQVRLERLGAQLTAPRMFERNIRYDNVQRTLTPRGVVVRLRQDTRTSLTYKDNGRTRDGIITRTEIEVEVSDFDAMSAILMKLGYTPYMVYEKYRATYELDGAEIVLDEMPYGSFVEIEGQEQKVADLMKRLELDQAPRMDGSYADLFERVKRHLGLTFDDLTFDNFKGVHVPEEAFKN